MNPYRDALYLTQGDWHHYTSAEFAQARHRLRAPYYRWFVKDWLPIDRSSRILDLGCGSGQFLWFLRDAGYNNAAGCDVDACQVELGAELGLDCRRASMFDVLRKNNEHYHLIAALDVLEHFSRSELFELMILISTSLVKGGRLIVSVPNAESPAAAATLYGDLTHESAFTWGSLQQLFYCHGLQSALFREPFPAPVSPLRQAYRLLTTFGRQLEAMRLRSMGFAPPRFWSHVLWAMCEKQ